MKIYRDLDEIQEKWEKPCVTIGNFDGVHVGHQCVFAEVRKSASENKGTAIAITFEPHPLQVLRPDGIKLISTTEQKVELIEMAGVDVLLLLPFSKEFAAIQAEDFVRDVLVKKIGVQHLFVGYDYAFGKGRTGSINFLKEQADSWGFDMTVIQPFYKNDAIVSSTRIRKLVVEGKMEETADLLGRYYQIRGTVQYGKQRGGKEIGFPTANLHITEEDLVPRSGVYVCQVICGDMRYDGVINVGYNPTFDEGVLVAEAHILEFDQNIYGKAIKVDMIHFLRGETKFAGVEALAAQIRSDIVEAKKILAEKKGRMSL